MTVHLARLTRAADYLYGLAVRQALKPKDTIRYNQVVWGASSEPTIHEGSCNTSACALGSLAIAGIFKREGLGYIVEENKDFIIPNTSDIDEERSPTLANNRGYIMKIMMKGKGDGLKAASTLFGLTEDETYRLFGSRNTNAGFTGPEATLAKANEIRAFVVQKRKAQQRGKRKGGNHAVIAAVQGLA